MKSTSLKNAWNSLYSRTKTQSNSSLVSQFFILYASFSS